MVGAISAVSFSRCGSMVASASSDMSLRVIDIERKEELSLLEAHRDWVRDVQWSTDGAILASAGYDGACYLWDRRQMRAAGYTVILKPRRS